MVRPAPSVRVSVPARVIGPLRVKLLAPPNVAALPLLNVRALVNVIPPALAWMVPPVRVTAPVPRAAGSPRLTVAPLRIVVLVLVSANGRFSVWVPPRVSVPAAPLIGLADVS